MLPVVADTVCEATTLQLASVAVKRATAFSIDCAPTEYTPGEGGGEAEKFGCTLKALSTRYWVLFGSLLAESIEQRPDALVRAMTAALPGTPLALNDTTPAMASCGASVWPRTEPENV